MATDAATLERHYEVNRAAVDEMAARAGLPAPRCVESIRDLRAQEQRANAWKTQR